MWKEEFVREGETAGSGRGPMSQAPPTREAVRTPNLLRHADFEEKQSRETVASGFLSRELYIRHPRRG
jgi:hypothetical protein